MAIIQGLPGLEVTIYTNGCTAKEYDDPSGTDEVHRRPRVVSKYIECKDNELFRIHLKATEKYSWGYKNHALNFAAVIDGIWAKGELCRQKDAKDEAWERDISYRVVKNPNEPARYVFQEFAFSTLIKVDWTTDDQRESDIERMERLGTIEVKVYRTIVQGNGPTFVPAGEHPEVFIVSQEATRGKSQSHGTKFTCTQPATKPNYVKCSRIGEDNGPIAIFRFKYRSRAALRLEGITPDPHTASDWFVEIPDDEKDEVDQDISRRNQRHPPSNSKQTIKKTKKEKQEEKHTVDIFALPYLCHDTKRSHNSNPTRPSRPEHSIFPDFQLPHSNFQDSTGHQNNAEVKTPKESMNERCPRIINQEAKRIVDDLEREQFSDRWARLNAKPRHNATRSVDGSTNFDAFIRAQLAMQAGSSNHGHTSDGKRTLDRTGLQNNSRKLPLVIDLDEDNNGNDKDVVLVREAETPRSSHPSNGIRPGAKRQVDMKAKINTSIKPKSEKTITRDIGRTLVFIDTDDNNRRGPTRRNINTGTCQRPRASSFAIPSIEASPQIKREQQFVIGYDKDQVIDVEAHYRGIQRLQELRQEFYRVSEDVFKEIESHRRPGSVAAATHNTLRSSTRTSNPPSSMPPPPPPPQRSKDNNGSTSNRTAIANASNSCTRPVDLLHGTSISSGAALTKPNFFLRDSKAQGTGNPSSSSQSNAEYSAHAKSDTSTSPSIKKDTSKSVKREFSETVDLTMGPIRLPRPFKMCKTHDGREAVDLADSD